jgi:succinoglycan biosynthesis protein ExoM
MPSLARSQHPFVSICIPTYRRPQRLRSLLTVLNRLSFSRMNPPGIEILVVDNDPDLSAETVCEAFRAGSAWPFRYVHEPQVGVSQARNRCIEEASPHADYIAFIDDDEVPKEDWLEALLIAQTTYNADIVAGPVFPIFESRTQSWIIAGTFFEPPPRPSGTQLDAAGTCNILLRAETLKGLTKAFDERFSTLGSEDTHLTMRLHKAGCRIVWAADAVVYEAVTEERTCLMWLINRAFWGWSSRSLFEREFFGSPAVLAQRAAKGMALVGFGVVSMLPNAFRGRHQAARSLLNIVKGLGSLAGLCGIQGTWNRSAKRNRVLPHSEHIL